MGSYAFWGREIHSGIGTIKKIRAYERTQESQMPFNTSVW